jgi:hypothetical protein
MMAAIGAAGFAGSPITDWCATCADYAVPMTDGTCGFCGAELGSAPSVAGPATELGDRPAPPPRLPLGPAHRRPRRSASARARPAGGLPALHARVRLLGLRAAASADGPEANLALLERLASLELPLGRKGRRPGLYLGEGPTPADGADACVVCIDLWRSSE